MDKFKLNIYTRRFIEGSLTPDKERELLNWIKADHKNQKEFLKEQEKLAPMVMSEPKNNVSEKWNKIAHSIQGHQLKTHNRSFVYRVASIAAAFLIGIIATVIVSNQLSITNKNTSQHNIYVPFGAKTNITLPDGSLVWLNSGSTLSYPSQFKKERPVILEGEAFFEVEKNSRPFIVHTQYGDVEVKGTSFNVKAFNKETLETTLESGSVLVKEKDSRNAVTLKPGEQARLEHGKLYIKNVSTEIFTSWKEGKLIFNNEYLPVVAQRLERWYNLTIELEDNPLLDNIWFTGTLEMETFSEVLELLKLTSPIDYTYNEKTRTILIKYKQK